MEPQQRHRRDNAEVEDAAALEDRGRVERDVQVGLRVARLGSPAASSRAHTFLISASIVGSKNSSSACAMDYILHIFPSPAELGAQPR